MRGINLKIEDELHERLRFQARENERSLAGEIRRILRRGVNHDCPEKKTTIKENDNGHEDAADLTAEDLGF